LLHPAGALEIVDRAPIGRFDPEQPSLPPFDEIYLLLYALDLEDEDAIVSLVGEFGALEIYEPYVDERFERAGEFAQAPYPALSAYPGFDDITEYDERTELLAQSERARSEIVDVQEIERGRVMPPPTIHEFRWAARCMKDLVRTYRCLREDRSPSDFHWDNPAFAFDVEQQEAGEPDFFWTRGRSMEEFLSGTLALGLADYSPRLVTRDDLFPRRAEHWAEHFGASARLWEICCLELFNHIAEGAIYKDCANELCGRPFVRQFGRAVHGQRRISGVRFCTHACARAQAQREYQRRKRAARHPPPRQQPGRGTPTSPR
jgi:hypothetical protein